MTVVCQTPTPHANAAIADGQSGLAKSRFLTPAGDLSLRVCGGEHDGQLLKIRSAKCTIGSGVGCTLRLRGCGVQSLACWILRGPSGTIIRRMHGPAMLNGAGFEEAALRPGDRLRIGGVELEVSNCQQPPVTPSPLFPPMEPANGEVAGLKAEVAKLQDRAGRLEAECKQGFEASIMAAERADQLRDALSTAHEQLESLSCDLQAAQDTVSQQTEELAGKYEELDRLHSSQRELVGQLEESNRRIAATAAGGEANRQEHEALVQQCSQLAQERDALRLERDVLRQERDALAEQQLGLAQERSEFVRDRDELTQQRDSLAREREALLLEGRSAVQARDASAQLQDHLTQERDALVRERDLQVQERANLVQERDSLQRERDTLAQERDQGTQERDALVGERDQLAQNRIQLEQERHAAVEEAAAARAESQAQGEQHRDERTLLERRLAQRDAEIESLRSSSAAQSGAMTVAMNELTQTQIGLREEIAQRCAELEAQLARQRGDAEAMARRFAEESIQRDTREQALTSDLEAKCRELNDFQQQLAELKQSNAAHTELDAREQELTAQRAQIEEELAAKRQHLEQELQMRRSCLEQELAEERSRLEQQAVALAQKEQNLSADQGALAAQANQLTQSREQWDLERDEFALQKQELCDAQEQLKGERINLEQQKEWLLSAQQEQTELRTAEVKLREQAAVIETELLEATQRLVEIERLRDELLAERGRLAQREHELNRQEASLIAQAANLEEARASREAEFQGQSAAAVADMPVAPEVECGNEGPSPFSACERPAYSGSTDAEPVDEESVANFDSPASLYEAIDASQASAMPVNCTAVWTPEQLAALNHQDVEPSFESSTPSEPNHQAIEETIGEAEAPTGEHSSGELPSDELRPALLQAGGPADEPGNVSDSGDVDALLGRLVRAGLWRKDEPSEQHPTSESVPSSQSFFTPPLPEPSTAAGETPALAAYAAAAVEEGAASVELLSSRESEAPAFRAVPRAASGGPDDEESIESYMERLMKRVRGDAPGVGPARPSAAKAQAPAQPAASAAIGEIVEEPVDEGEYSPRRTAPELATNMSAMRELANTAARSAIDQHVRQHTGRQATGKLLGACLTVASSVAVGYWAIRAFSLPAAVAAIIGGCAGSYWTWAAFKRLAALRRLNEQTAANSVDANQAVPSAPVQAESRSFVGRPSVPLTPDS